MKKGGETEWRFVRENWYIDFTFEGQRIRESILCPIRFKPFSQTVPII